MKVIYAKSTILRNRAFAMETTVVEDTGRRLVVKKPVYPEGVAHIERICANQVLLKSIFPQAEINKVWLEDNKLYAEYIDGFSLTKHYRSASAAKDKQTILNLLDRHLSLACGSKNNICAFEKTEDFSRIFRDAADNALGEPALKVMNFDMMADNVFLRNGDMDKPILIDYEWVFEFPVPIAFLHCFIIDSLFIHVENLGNIFAKEELIRRSKFFNSRLDYAAMWNYMTQYFRFEKSIDAGRIAEIFTGDSSISVETKLRRQIAELDQAMAEHIDTVQKQQAHIEYQNGRIAELDQTMAEHIDAVQKQQAHIEYQNGRIAELDQAMAEHIDAVRKQQAHIEYQNGRIAELDQAMAEHIDAVRKQQAHIEYQNIELKQLQDELNDKGIVISQQKTQIEELQQTLVNRIVSWINRKGN